MTSIAILLLAGSCVADRRGASCARRRPRHGQDRHHRRQGRRRSGSSRTSTTCTISTCCPVATSSRTSATPPSSRSIRRRRSSGVRGQAEARIHGEGRSACLSAAARTARRWSPSRATPGSSRWTSDGKIVKEVPLTVNNPIRTGTRGWSASWTSGHYLVCHEGDGCVREYDAEGKVVWEYKLDLGGRPRPRGTAPKGTAWSFRRGPAGQRQHAHRRRQQQSRPGSEPRRAKSSGRSIRTICRESPSPG